MTAVKLKEHKVQRKSENYKKCLKTSQPENKKNLNWHKMCQRIYIKTVNQY